MFGSLPAVIEGAVRSTPEVEHDGVGSVMINNGADVNCTVSGLLVACAVVMHVALLVITTLTISPWLSVLLVYVLLLVPVGWPLSSHW